MIVNGNLEAFTKAVEDTASLARHTYKNHGRELWHIYAGLCEEFGEYCQAVLIETRGKISTKVLSEPSGMELVDILLMVIDIRTWTEQPNRERGYFDIVNTVAPLSSKLLMCKIGEQIGLIGVYVHDLSLSHTDNIGYSNKLYRIDECARTIGKAIISYGFSNWLWTEGDKNLHVDHYSYLADALSRKLKKWQDAVKKVEELHAQRVNQVTRK